MASNAKLIRIILRLEDEMSSSLNKATSSLDQVGKKMQSVGMSMTQNITAPIVAVGAAMFKTFADYQDVMAEVQARTQATAGEMEMMSKVAIEMGRDTVFSATEAGEALLELTASGSSAAEAVEQLKPVLDLAAAGALDLKTAADGVTDVLKQFQLGAESATLVANNLAAAAGSSSATVSDLLQGFGNVGPVAAQFGLNVNETAAALAIFSENGIKGAEAGTQLRSMLLNMSRDTKKVSNTWVELGVSMYDSAGNMRDIDDIFKDINKAMEDMSMEDQIRIARNLGGSYGIMGFNALRASNGISDMQANMLDAATASEVAQARMNTLSGRFKSLMGSLETLAIVLGGLGEGPLTGFIETLTKIINKITEWAEKNPKLAQTIMIVIAALAALGPILMIIGSIASGVSAIAGAFAALAPILATVAGAIAGLSLPVALAIAAIVALVTAYATNFMGFRDLVNQTVRFIIDGLILLAKFIVNPIGTIIDLFKMLFNGDGTLGLGEDSPIIQGINKLKESVTNFANEIPNKIKNVVLSFSQMALNIIDAFEQLKPAMKQVGINIITGLIQGVTSMIADFINMVKDLAQSVVDTVKGALKIKSPSQVMMGLGEQVVAGFNKGIDSMQGIGVNVNGTSLSGGGNTPSVAAGGGGGRGINIGTLILQPTSANIYDEINRKLARDAQKKGASRNR